VRAKNSFKNGVLSEMGRRGRESLTSQGGQISREVKEDTKGKELQAKVIHLMRFPGGEEGQQKDLASFGFQSKTKEMK